MPYDYFAGLHRDVGNWATRTFPENTDLGIVTHLEREVEELRDAVLLMAEHPEAIFKVAEETADCIILLMALTHKHMIPIEDSVRTKHLVNTRRQWGPPDSEGVHEHIRDNG